DQAAVDDGAERAGKGGLARHRAAVVDDGDDGIVLDRDPGAGDDAAVGHRAQRPGVQDRPTAVGDRAGVDQLADAALVP
ncbi:hypothetical protein FE76_14775, partial [Staphylococcus aureus]